MEFEGTTRYLIQRRLGVGGFGVVYQALDRQQNAVIALKTLHRAGSDALFRFKREFRALADISHPNLVSLYDLISDGEQWLFTMELVHGVDFLEYTGLGFVPVPAARPVAGRTGTTHSLSETLTGALPSHDPASQPPSPARLPCRSDPDRLRAATRQLAEGLGELHRAGKLHQDIKPSNVLVTPEGRVVILDFGLIADTGPADAAQQGSLAGTPAYMSPEQCSGQAVCEAADWYAVGVILFEALTGRRPFAGTPTQIIASKQQFEAPEISTLTTGAPDDLVSLCRELLRRDPRLRPTGAEVLGRLGVPADAVGQFARTPFLGRRRELNALHDALATVRRKGTAVVLLQGSSGIGKSALVNEFLQSLTGNRDVIALASRCFEREAVPYKAFDGAIDLLTRYLKLLPHQVLQTVLPRELPALARLFPALRELEAGVNPQPVSVAIADPRELRQHAFGALRELLARLSQTATLVWFIDDLQWGDADSAALLTDILQPPTPPGILWIACYRTEEAATSPLLQALQSSIVLAGSAVEVTELALTGLPADVSERLAIAASAAPGAVSAARAGAIAREAVGNPLFIAELARTPEEDTRPASLEEVIRARVLRLSEPARRLLEVVAVAGQPIDLAVAKQAAQHVGADYEVMSALRGGHLVRMRTAGGHPEIETYHDRIREAVGSGLDAQNLTACHTRLALALEASPHPDPEMLAVHFHGSGDRLKASHYAAVGGEQADAALAFDRAARLYRFSLDLETGDAGRRRRLGSMLGSALGNAGRGAESAEAYLDATAGATRQDALEYRRRAASQLLMSGHLEQGIGVLREVLAASGMRLARTPWHAAMSVILHRALIRLRGLGFREAEAARIPAEAIMRIDTCWSVAQGLGAVDIIRAADFQMRHLLLALKAGEPYRASRALAVEAGYYALGGGRCRDRTQIVLETNRVLAEKIQQEYPHALGLATLTEGIAAFLEGRWRRARTLHDSAETILRERCRGVAWELATARLMWSVSLFFLGELPVLAERLPVLLKEAEARGDLYEATDLRIRISHANWLAADEPDTARREVTEAISRWPKGEFYVQHWWSLIANTEISLYAGQDEAAWDLIQHEWPRLKRSFLLRVQYIWIETLCHRAAAALAVAAGKVTLERRRALLNTARSDALRIQRERMEWSDPLAQLLQAGIAVADGDRKTAASLLRTAESGFERAEMHLYASATRRHLGELLDGDEGQRLIEAADAWMVGRKIHNPARMAAMLAPGEWRRS